MSSSWSCKNEYKNGGNQCGFVGCGSPIRTSGADGGVTCSMCRRINYCSVACSQRDMYNHFERTSYQCGFHVRDIHHLDSAAAESRRKVYQTPQLEVAEQHLGGSTGVAQVGTERHDTMTQVVICTAGSGWISVGRSLTAFTPSSMVVIPPREWHNIWVEEGGELWFYSLYAPPHEYQ